MRIARSATALVLAASALLAVIGMYARSQPAGPEQRGVLYTAHELRAVAQVAGDQGRRALAGAGRAQVEDAPLAALRSGSAIWWLFAGGALLMVGGSVMPLARWYAEERGKGAPLAGMLSAAERDARDEVRARRALEEVVDDLGAELAGADARIPGPAVLLVSEALTTAYARGVAHGMRRAADDLEAQAAELGVDLRVMLDEPGPGGARPPGP